MCSLVVMFYFSDNQGDQKKEINNTQYIENYSPKNRLKFTGDIFLLNVSVKSK